MRIKMTMKLGVLLLAGLVLLQPWKATAQPLPSWKTILASDETFSISFPSNPLKRTKNIETSSGAIQIVSYAAKSKQEPIAYFFSYSLLSDGNKKLSPKDLLSRATRSALKSFGGILKSKKTLTFTTHRGYELLIVTDEKKFIRNRIYVIEQRIYQLVVTGPEKEVLGANAKRFFQSFKIID